MVLSDIYTNPFPGIRSYEIGESDRFFGREKQINELLIKLSATGFVAVVGSSGCGKSSLIKAGLIPALLSGKSVSLPSNWHSVTLRPGDTPVENLATAIAGDTYNPAEVLSVLQSDNTGLIKAIDTYIDKHKTALLFVDQFEELFRFSSTPETKEKISEAHAFINLLTKTVNNPDTKLFIILSMRTDFLDNCTEFRELSEIINKGYYLVPRMTADEKRLAITGPVELTGNTISTSLVERLLLDAGESADQLPVMQHALMRTWEHWLINRQGNDPLDNRNYEAIGTMKEALSVHLEELYGALSDDRSKLNAEKIFKALTDVSQESRGTRRPTPLSVICTLTRSREEEIIKIIDIFRSPSCSFLMPMAGITLESDTIIDISHESIMRVWTRLRKWTEEEAASAQLYLRLSKSAELYQQGKTGLWINPDLQVALHWKEITKPNITWADRYDSFFDRAMTFLEHSRKQHELAISNKEKQTARNLKRARNSAILLGIASVISILFLIISLNLRFKAEASSREALEKEKMATVERQKAEKQSREAIIQRKISEQQQMIAEQQGQIAEQQRENAVNQQFIAQQQTAVAVQQRSAADLARKEALTARDEAQLQRKEAVAQKQIADEQRLKAESSERSAQRLRLLAIANAMAIQSLQLHSTVTDDSPALYALTAYQLNKQYGGSPTEPAIYNALSAISGDPVTLRGHTDAVRAMAITENGQQLYTCGNDRKILRWDMNDPTQKAIEAIIPKTLTGQFRSITITHDSKWLIAGTTTGKLIIWSISSFPQSTRIVDAHTSIINDLISDPKANSFYSAGSDGRIYRWDYNNNDFTVQLLDAAAEPVNSIDVHPEGGKLVAVTSKGDVRLINQDMAIADKNLNTASNAMIDRAVSIYRFGNQALSVKFSPTGETVVAGCNDGSLQVLTPDASGRYSAQTYKARHLSGITSIAFNPAGNRITTSGFDWSVRSNAWPVSDDIAITITRHELWIYDVLFSPDGKKFISCGADKTVRIFSTKLDPMAERLAKSVKRNFTEAEWKRVIGEDVPYHKTIESIE